MGFFDIKPAPATPRKRPSPDDRWGVRHPYLEGVIVRAVVMVVLMTIGAIILLFRT